MLRDKVSLVNALNELRDNEKRAGKDAGIFCPSQQSHLLIICLDYRRVASKNDKRIRSNNG